MGGNEAEIQTLLSDWSKVNGNNFKNKISEHTEKKNIYIFLFIARVIKH